ncbi:MAG TPA: metallophosphoesterase [Planctomycetota bacterium]|nr:metallophosphoesterase [Planctomycetota bacterium]HRR79726.1 metallophosphoesterase [Planctomycetota bacterium]HRT93229.1 metallophosphoesterase [Planctomycetota bacterium]
MNAFVLLVLAAYVAMQLLIYWRLRRALPAGRAGRAAVVGWFALMGAALFLARPFESLGWHVAANAAGVAGHWWVVASMWVILFGVACEVWNLVPRCLPPLRRLRIRLRVQAVAAAAMVAGLTAWGVVEMHAVRIETLAVPTARLPAGSRPIRVVQFSDLHLNSLMSRSRLERILAAIREARPDLLVFTGDLADESSPHVERLAVRLAALEAPLGKLAVTGNHEFYRGLARTAPLFDQAGFRLLRGERLRVAPGVLVAGVDDYAAERLGIVEADQEDRALPPPDRAEFAILLKHRPHVEPGAAGRFDLQLSGHTHGGQVFPGLWPLRFFYRYTRGRYELGGGAELYVTRGVGTYGVPLRVFSPPEVTVILLQP